MSVYKHAIWIPVSAEVLADNTYTEPTPEELAEWTARRARYDAELARWTQAARAVTDPIGAAVLEIHTPPEDYSSCTTCDDWPCPTAEAVMHQLGYITPESA